MAIDPHTAKLIAKVSEYDSIMKNYNENSIYEDLLNEVKKSLKTN